MILLRIALFLLGEKNLRNIKLPKLVICCRCSNIQKSMGFSNSYSNTLEEVTEGINNMNYNLFYYLCISPREGINFSNQYNKLGMLY